jgi:hypothetical protein
MIVGCLMPPCKLTLPTYRIVVSLPMHIIYAPYHIGESTLLYLG